MRKRCPADIQSYEFWMQRAEDYRRRGLFQMEKFARQQAKLVKKTHQVEKKNQNRNFIVNCYRSLFDFIRN